MTRPALGRDEAGTLLGRKMGLVAATLGLFALGAYLGRDLAYGWALLFFLGSLLSLVGVGALTGLAAAPPLAYYASADPRGVAGRRDDGALRRRLRGCRVGDAS
jgi:uncharacterized protein